MNITCPSCKARYAVDDARVPPQGVTIRCPSCHHTFVARRSDPRHAPANHPSSSDSSDREREAPAAQGPVPLPGKTQPADAPASTPVPLPGQQRTPPPSVAAATGAPLKASSSDSYPHDAHGSETPSNPHPNRKSQDLDDLNLAFDADGDEDLDKITSDILGFIEETREKASVDITRESAIEYFVRHRSGKIDGPMGMDHIKACLRNGVLNGREDISEDAVAWRALASDNELNAVITSSAPAASQPRPKSSMDELLGSLDLAAPTPDIPNDPGYLPSYTDELEVDELPERLTLWERCKHSMVPIGALIAVFVVGLAIYSALPWQTLDMEKALETTIAQVTQQTLPGPPSSDGPIQRERVRATIAEGAFEGFRSLISAIERSTPIKNSDLFLAKARVWAGLHFGTDVFPLAKTQAAIRKLSASPSSNMDGNDRDKIKAGLALLEGEPAAARTLLLPLARANPEDAEVAFLTGIAEQALGNEAAALSAYDRALVHNSAYAAVYFRIGHMYLARKNLDDAAFWLNKARRALPKQAGATYLLATIYQQRNQLGTYRNVLAEAAHAASYALPPQQRGKVLWETVRAFDEAHQLALITPIAEELSRFAPEDPQAVVYGALAKALQGEFEPALQVLNQLISQHPKHLQARIARARTYMRQKHIAKALLELEQARPLDSGTDALLWQVRFHLELGKHAEASRVLSSVTHRTADALPHAMLAQIARQNGQLDDAMTAAKAAINADENHILGHLELGLIHAHHHDWPRAEAAFRRVLALDEYNLRATLGLADVLKAQAAQDSSPTTSMKLAEAIPLYLTSLQRRPHHPHVLFAYGSALEFMGDWVGALELYKQATAVDQKDVRPHLKMVAAHLKHQPPDISAARSALQKAQAVEEESGRPVAHIHLWEARLAMLGGHPDKAESSMRKALQMEPNNPEFHYWHGRALELNSALFEAIGAYKKALKLDEHFADAYRSLGQAELERFRFQPARKHFRKYLQMRPHDATIWMDIGRSFSRQNRDRDALKAFLRVLHAEPNFVEAHLQIGQIMSRQGDEGKAQQHFQKVLKVDADNAEAWCMLGLSLGQVRVNRPAQRALKRCIESPDSPRNLVDTARRVLEN